MCADDRHFTYLYEAPTADPGEREVEIYATSNFLRGFAREDFREEIEFGITPHLQLGVYLADWSVRHSAKETQAGFNGGAVEAIYNFLDPKHAPIGLSLYQEIALGRQKAESETKLILQKNVGRWIAVYNVTLDAGWEGHGLQERTGELKNAVGLSCEFTHSWSAGAELIDEIVLPDWRTSHAGNNLFIGPNASFRGHHWYATITALAAVATAGGEPDLQVRLIFGFER